MQHYKHHIQIFAKKAGLLLLKEFRKKQLSARFSPKEAKSTYDKASELLIKKLIKKKYPEHSILAEETGYEERDASYLWIVDPLDGTSNFINGNPFFAVSIALQIKGKLSYAAIYAPFLKEFFFASRNEGAFLNGKRITVSAVSDLKRSYLVACEGSIKNRRKIAEIWHSLILNSIDLRKLGSAALECAWVASSRADAFITTGIPAYDVAAGVLLVEEAGGKVSDFKAKPWKPKKTNFIASNGKLHKKLVRILKKF
ncbi:MAG: inositol monophosphatase [Candidatus Diapherotrites archaeon]|nr:inositol monophosphatase [Candidatus Diapherotrites archaeon]